MYNFREGDKVVVRDWDDMASEFGVGATGNILCRFRFIRGMDNYCGVICYIESIDTNGDVKLRNENGLPVLREYRVSTDMIKPYNDIDIKFDPEELKALFK